MTKTHFISIAAALKVSRPCPEIPKGATPKEKAEIIFHHAHKRHQWERTRAAMVEMAKSYNPRFDEERFIAATEKD